MSVQSISPFFENHLVTIESVPSVDESMRALFSELHQKHPAPQSLTSLSERIRDLADTEEILQSVKAKGKWASAVEMVAAAISTGLIAATVLGFLTNPLTGLAFLIPTLIFFLFCHQKAMTIASHERRENTSLALCPFAVFLSPFILFHYLFTRTSFLEKTAALYRDEVQVHALESRNYWSTNGAQLTKQVALEEERVDQTLAAVQKLPIRSSNGEQSLTAYKDLLARSRIAIEKGRALAEKIT